jgi:hypothetical protein
MLLRKRLWPTRPVLRSVDSHTHFDGGDRLPPERSMLALKMIICMLLTACCCLCGMLREIQPNCCIPTNIR